MTLFSVACGGKFLQGKAASLTMTQSASSDKALREAMAAFRLGRRCYEVQQFKWARHWATVYREKVDYQAFQREDRRANHHPLWSVVIVSYNTGTDLLACLDSVFRQKQSDYEYEVILVDNGKNSAIEARLCNYPILHVWPPRNMLPSEGRNIGAQLARGRYLAFVDDDGLVTENYLREGEEALAQPKVIGARGRIIPKTEGGATNHHYDQGAEPKPARFNLEGNMVIHRDLFLQVGGFDPMMFGHEGNELGKRLDEAYKGYHKLYWPALKLKHDFAEAEKLAAKTKRQELGKSYIKFMRSNAQVERSMEKKQGGNMTASKAGISIIVRAGNNEKAAKSFLKKLAALNSYKPVEAFVFLSQPADDHLALVTEFAGRIRVAILRSAEKSIADIARITRYDSVLLVSTPAEPRSDCLAQLWKQLNSQNSPFLKVPALHLTNSTLITKDAAAALTTTPVYTTGEELEALLEDPFKPGSQAAEKVQHWKVRAEGAPLDTQIDVLEAELLKKDTQLTALYDQINELDQQYDALSPERDEAKKLKAKLKGMVENSNERLKELKTMHDQLEHLRIRKYSLTA